MPERILQILPDLGMSGPAFAAYNLLPELRALGCKVAVIARRGGERAGAFKSGGAEAEYELPRLGSLLDFKSKEIAENFRPDIIHATCAEVAQAAARIAAACNIPLAITVNRLGTDHLLCKVRFDKLKNRWGIIALSAAISSTLIINMRFPESRIALIPHGLDMNKFPMPSDAPRLIVPKRALIIGTYGTLAEEKGQRDFIYAAAVVIGRGFDAEFLIMGDGADKQKLREEANELRIGNRLTFSLSTITDMHNLMNVDVFVEPTHSEGFGLSVLQAMASGVPVVANGVGGIFDLIKDGEHGLLVRSRKVEAMSEAICKLLANPSLRTELAQNARVRVEKEFSVKVTAPKILAHFDKICAGKW